ncbi:ankyrin repeat-containing domain protein, partial [Baffinella frigidus]
MLRGVGGQADAERKRMADALFTAAGTGDKKEVQRLIAGGADVNFGHSNGSTALHWAAANGFEEVVRTLLDAGAEVAAKNNGGDTALHFGAINGHEGVAKVLLGAGADVAAKDSAGATALLYGATNGHEGVVTILLDAGADAAAKAMNGQTALDLAQERGHEGVARVLRDVGVAQAASDAARRTEKTLDLAKMQKEKGTAEYQKLSYATAAEAYSKAIRLTEMLKPPLPEEQQAATRALKLKCLTELAKVRSKLEDHAGVVQACDDALSLDPDNEEALFRRAMSRTELGDITSAAADLARVLSINPSNTEATEAARKLHETKALCDAAGAGEIEEVRRLIAGGADVSAEDSDGQTVLQCAACNGHK